MYLTQCVNNFAFRKGWWQVKFFATKPLLEDVFKVAEKYASDMGLPQPRYNIEIKSSPDGDGIYHPEVPEFSDKVVKLIAEELGWERVNIQSFDFRVLQYIHENYPEVPLAMLVENAATYQEDLKELGFAPDIFSPHFRNLNAEIIAFFHHKGMTQEKGDPTLEEQSDKEKESIINNLSKNEHIKEILNIFPGAKIEEVKDKGEEDE